MKRSFSSQIYERGLRYYKTGHVLTCVYDREEDIWFGTIAGNESNAYEVSLAIGGRRFLAECDCPYEDYCKHIVALAIQVIREGEKEPTATDVPLVPPPPEVLSWHQQLEAALASPEDTRTALEPPPEVGKRYPVYRLHLDFNSGVRIGLREARFGKRGLGSDRPLYLGYYSDKLPDGTSLRQEGLIALLLTLPTEGTSQYVIPFNSFDTILEMLEGYPFVFLENTPKPLRISPPLKSEVVMAEEKDGLRLKAVYRDGAGNPYPFGSGTQIISGRRLWLFQEGAANCDFHPISTQDDPRLLFALTRQALVVPPDEVGRFLTDYLPRLARKTVASLPPSLREKVISPRPRPVLTLEEDDGNLVLTLAFAYGDGPGQHLASGAETAAELLEVPWEDGVRYLRRDLEAERSHHARLEELGLQKNEDDRYRLDGDSSLDFLWEMVPLLEKDAFEIYGVETLANHRVVRRSPKSAVSLTSGLDWFELDLAAVYDEETAAGTNEILTALASGRRYVRLGNGSWGKLPEAFLTQKTLLDEIKEARTQTAAGKGKGLRLARTNTALAAAILDAAEEKRTDSSWVDFRRSLESFAGVRPAPLPASFRGDLRPYQKHGYDWLSFLRDYRLGGVLADEMGLGKTVQTLALLLAEKESGSSHQPSLLVVPKSVVFNWAEEASRFAPTLRVLSLTGAGRDELFSRLDEYDLVVTTYATAMRDVDLLAERQFRYLILDEAQNIKNPSGRTAQTMKEIRAEVRLALTGTPLENNLTELWSIFDFLMPGFLGSLQRFETRYARPAQGGDQDALARLRRRVAPFILRRLKTDVLPDLPPKTELVRWCELPPAQAKLYRQVLATCRTKVMDEVREKGFERSHIAVLDALLKLRQVACHPQLLKLPGNRVTASAKLDLFREVVEELLEEGQRALVFSQFVEMLTILRRELEGMGIPYEYLDGSTRDRKTPVDRFNGNRDIPLFLISLKAGGTGLNLTGASYVIHYDPWWNPAAEDQATGRAHRIGQTKEVFSLKLIARGTVEEKILELQKRKRQLAQDILGGTGGRALDLTRADLEELFS